MATLLGDSNSDDSSSDESSLDVSLISSSRASFMSTNNNSPTPLKHKMSRWLGKLNLPGGNNNEGNTTNLDFNNITFSSSGSETDSSDSDYDATKTRKKKRSVLRFDLDEDLSVSDIGSFLGATNNFSDDEDLQIMKHGKVSYHVTLLKNL